MYIVLKQGSHILLVFIDLKLLRKAFDTIDRSIILEKLENYGVRGTNRNKYVNFLCEFSQQLPVIFGVPRAVGLTRYIFSYT